MFASYIKVYGRRIHRMAIRLALYDLDLADDLEQAGRIAIWRFNPVRVRNSESAIVMRVARDAMLKWIHREERAQIIIPLSLIPPVRLQAPTTTEQNVAPIRRIVPRHRDALPVMDRLAA
jgi:hypothetical protein